MTARTITITLVRHGESTWNAEGRWQGQADPPLSDEGLRQAALVGRRLAAADVDRIVVSDLARARQTADAIAAHHGHDPEVDAAWRELHVGDWSGRTTQELRTLFPDQWKAFSRGEDIRRGGSGETLAELHARVATAFDRVLADAVAQRHRRVVVVAHGGVVRAAALHAVGLAHLVNTPLPLTAPRNTSVSDVTLADGALRLTVYNDAHHLDVRRDAASGDTALDG